MVTLGPGIPVNSDIDTGNAVDDHNKREYLHEIYTMSCTWWLIKVWCQLNPRSSGRKRRRLDKGVVFIHKKKELIL